MDDIVKQAMTKWPNVPSVYGWLSLDRRGNWLIKGERISNPVITDFIGRNYGHDEQGHWFFQNGPQRVFVALAYTPYVYRLNTAPDHGSSPRIASHTGVTVTRVDGAWIDETGIVLLATELGLGMMDDRDLDRLEPCFSDALGSPLSDDEMVALVELLQAGNSADLYLRHLENCVRVSPVMAKDVARTFGFVAWPAPAPGTDECI